MHKWLILYYIILYIYYIIWKVPSMYQTQHSDNLRIISSVINMKCLDEAVVTVPELSIIQEARVNEILNGDIVRNRMSYLV